MIDKTAIALMIQAAAQINKDGQVATVMADAARLLDFYNERVENARVGEGLRFARHFTSEGTAPKLAPGA